MPYSVHSTARMDFTLPKLPPTPTPLVSHSPSNHQPNHDRFPKSAHHHRSHKKRIKKRQDTEIASQHKLASTHQADLTDTHQGSRRVVQEASEMREARRRRRRRLLPRRRWRWEKKSRSRPPATELAAETEAQMRRSRRLFNSRKPPTVEWSLRRPAREAVPGTCPAAAVAAAAAELQNGEPHHVIQRTPSDIAARPAATTAAASLARVFGHECRSDRGR